MLATGLRGSFPDVRVLDGNLTGPGGGGKNLFDTPSPDDLGTKSPATPDIVLRRSNSAGDTDENLTVFEVKYKVYTPRAGRDDVNQTLTYAASYGAPVAVIAHPHQGKSKHGLRTVGRVGGVTLYQYGFDLSADDLEQEESAFVSSVQALMRAQNAG